MLQRSQIQPYENEVILRGQNISLKCYQPLELLTHFREGIRSLHTSNIGSVGSVSKGLTLSGSRSFLKFDRRQLYSPLIYRPHITVLKDLNLISKYVKSSRGLQRFKGGFCSLKMTSFS